MILDLLLLTQPVLWRHLLAQLIIMDSLTVQFSKQASLRMLPMSFLMRVWLPQAERKWRSSRSTLERWWLKRYTSISEHENVMPSQWSCLGCSPLLTPTSVMQSSSKDYASWSRVSILRSHSLGDWLLLLSVIFVHWQWVSWWKVNLDRFMMIL